MKKVIANRTFRHSASRTVIRPGEEVPGDREYHEELIGLGLAREAAVRGAAPEAKPGKAEQPRAETAAASDESTAEAETSDAEQEAAESTPRRTPRRRRSNSAQ